MSSKKPYYISTAIAYTSGRPHIGNDYEIVLADVIARFKRLQGLDVYFQTGTDEHGLKIAQKAKEKGITPQAYVDEMSRAIQDNYDTLNISYDKFVRTTDPIHQDTVSKVFKKLYDQGDIYKSVYEGWYCVSCESFYTESQLNPDHTCPEGHSKVHKEKEETYFFKLSKYQDQLVKYLNDHPDYIQPALRKNEMLNNFILPGLQDLAVSRQNFDWGIKTFDPKHVVYVWLDALMNYITNLGYDPDGNHSEAFKKYWPADLHLIGKDIMRFHSIYWTIFLFALGLDPAKHIFGHPWLLNGQGKMSKSMGKVIYSKDVLPILSVDGLRFLMIHEMPYDRDGTLTFEIMVNQINAELVNNLGNLVKRVLTMNQKYFQGKVLNTKVHEAVDDDLIQQAQGLKPLLIDKMDSLHVQDALKAIFDLFKRANKYIDETAPWILAKEEEHQDRLQTVLYNLLESIRIGAISLSPFLPETSQKILAQLKTQETSFDSIQTFGQLEDGLVTEENPSTLFERLDVQESLAALDQATSAKPLRVLDHKDEISIEDFDKLELRCGKIVDCQKHPKADKLLVFQVDLGDKVTQIVSGIAKFYQPQDLIGKNVMVLVNLKPITLRGQVSNGMILSGLKEDGSLQVVDLEGLDSGDSIA